MTNTIPPPRQELLTADEHRAVEMAGELYNLLCTITGRGETREADLNELVHHIHAIQRAVLKQAAARAYPDRYRLLGRTIADDAGWPRGESE